MAPQGSSSKSSRHRSHRKKEGVEDEDEEDGKSRKSSRHRDSEKEREREKDEENKRGHKRKSSDGAGTHHSKKTKSGENEEEVLEGKSRKERKLPDSDHGRSRENCDSGSRHKKSTRSLDDGAAAAHGSDRYCYVVDDDEDHSREKGHKDRHKGDARKEDRDARHRREHEHASEGSKRSHSGREQGSRHSDREKSRDHRRKPENSDEEHRHKRKESNDEDDHRKERRDDHRKERKDDHRKENKDGRSHKSRAGDEQDRQVSSNKAVDAEEKVDQDKIKSKAGDNTESSRDDRPLKTHGDDENQARRLPSTTKLSEGGDRHKENTDSKDERGHRSHADFLNGKEHRFSSREDHDRMNGYSSRKEKHSYSRDRSRSKDLPNEDDYTRHEKYRKEERHCGEDDERSRQHRKSRDYRDEDFRRPSDDSRDERRRRGPSSSRSSVRPDDYRGRSGSYRRGDGAEDSWSWQNSFFPPQFAPPYGVGGFFERFPVSMYGRAAAYPFMRPPTSFSADGELSDWYGIPSRSDYEEWRRRSSRDPCPDDDQVFRGREKSPSPENSFEKNSVGNRFSLKDAAFSEETRQVLSRLSVSKELAGPEVYEEYLKVMADKRVEVPNVELETLPAIASDSDDDLVLEADPEGEALLRADRAETISPSLPASYFEAALKVYRKPEEEGRLQSSLVGSFILPLECLPLLQQSQVRAPEAAKNVGPLLSQERNGVVVECRNKDGGETSSGGALKTMTDIVGRDFSPGNATGNVDAGVELAPVEDRDKGVDGLFFTTNKEITDSGDDPVTGKELSPESNGISDQEKNENNTTGAETRDQTAEKSTVKATSQELDSDRECGGEISPLLLQENGRQMDAKVSRENSDEHDNDDRSSDECFRDKSSSDGNLQDKRSKSRENGVLELETESGGKGMSKFPRDVEKPLENC